MKKIMIITMTMVFTLALGLAYASENAVTDFTGRSYEAGDDVLAAETSHMEGAAAGGVRLVEIDTGMLDNGITDFTGRSYETFEINAAPADGNVVEGSAAGGLRQNWAGEKTSVTSYEESNLIR